MQPFRSRAGRGPFLPFTEARVVADLGQKIGGIVKYAIEILGQPRLRDMASFFDVNRAVGESERFRELDLYEAYYWGAQHDVKTVLWDGRSYIRPVDRGHAYRGGYGGIKLDNPPPWYMRRPYTRYQLCRAVVDRFTGLLCGEKKTPTLRAVDEKGQEWIDHALKATGWWRKWALARTYGGAMGTVVVGVKLRQGRPVVEVLNAKWCTPRWKDDDPETGELASLEVLYKHPVSQWLDLPGGRREWKTREQWYRRLIDTSVDVALTAPISTSGGLIEWTQKGEAVTHDLGFVPFVWVKNIESLADDDGAPDCDQQWDNLDAIDALLTDAFQGTHYNADPTLVMKTMRDATRVKTGSSSTITLDPNEDAFLLELAGTGGEVAEKRALALRDIVLQTTRCVLDQSTGGVARTATETLKLNEAMYQRADEFRAQYGDAMERVFEMMLTICRKAGQTLLVPSTLADVSKVPMPAEDDIEVEWPPYVEMDPQTQTQEILKWVAARGARLCTQETAVRGAAHALGVGDVKKELDDLAAESAAGGEGYEGADLGGGEGPPEETPPEER